MELVDVLRRERTEDRTLGNYSPVKTKQKKGEKRTEEKWSEGKELILCRVMSQKSLEEGLLRKQILRVWREGKHRLFSQVV